MLLPVLLPEPLLPVLPGCAAAVWAMPVTVMRPVSLICGFDTVSLQPVQVEAIVLPAVAVISRYASWPAACGNGLGTVSIALWLRPWLPGLLPR